MDVFYQNNRKVISIVCYTVGRLVAEIEINGQRRLWVQWVLLFSGLSSLLFFFFILIIFLGSLSKKINIFKHSNQAIKLTFFCVFLLVQWNNNYKASRSNCPLLLKDRNICGIALTSVYSFNTNSKRFEKMNSNCKRDFILCFVRRKLFNKHHL